MRHILGTTPTFVVGTLLSLALLTGCGDEGGVASGPPEAPPTSATSTPTPDPDDWRLIDLVSETAAGGSTSTEVTVVDDPDDLSTFTDQFSSDAFAQEIADAVDGHEPRPGYAVAAAVVSVGCDVPTDVTYVDGSIRAVKVPNPLPECFAPVTTVAVVEVPV